MIVRLRSRGVRRAAVATTLALAGALTALSPTRLEAMPEGFVTPIIALEFVRDAATLEVLFGATPDPRVLAALDRAHAVDFAFALAYASLLAVAGAALAPTRARSVATLAALAAAADYVENLALLAITASLRGGVTPTTFTQLVVATSVKWGAIVIGGALIAHAMPTTRLRAALGLASALALVGFVGSLVSPPYFAELLALGVLAVFLVLALGTLRPPALDT